MHVERNSYKCQREKIQKQQNFEMVGVTLVKFLRKRKNFQAIYFHLLPGSGKPFLNSKVKEEKEKFPIYILYFHLLLGPSKPFLPSNFEEKKEEKCPR